MLEGERVVLRPIQSWDRERLYELVETIEVQALASNDPPLPLSLEEVEARDRKWLEERHADSAWFAIDVDESLVGMCGLHSIDHYHQRAEVGVRAVGAYRKAGFVEEGRLRNHTWYDGRRHDELVMSVLREEREPSG